MSLKVFLWRRFVQLPSLANIKICYSSQYQLSLRLTHLLGPKPSDVQSQHSKFSDTPLR